MDKKIRWAVFSSVIAVVFAVVVYIYLINSSEPQLGPIPWFQEDCTRTIGTYVASGSGWESNGGQNGDSCNIVHATEADYLQAAIAEASYNCDNYVPDVKCPIGCRKVIYPPICVLISMDSYFSLEECDAWGRAEERGEGTIECIPTNIVGKRDVLLPN